MRTVTNMKATLATLPAAGQYTCMTILGPATARIRPKRPELNVRRAKQAVDWGDVRALTCSDLGAGDALQAALGILSGAR